MAEAELAERSQRREFDDQPAATLRARLANAVCGPANGPRVRAAAAAHRLGLTAR